MIGDAVKAALAVLAISCCSKPERVASAPAPPAVRHDATAAEDAVAVRHLIRDAFPLLNFGGTQSRGRRKRP